MIFELEANLTAGWAMKDIKSPTDKAGYGIVALLGVVGNSIVCYVFRSPPPHNRSSYFIFHLAVADFTACLLAAAFHLLPLDLTFDDTNRVLGEVVCRAILSKFPMWVSISASVFTLIALTVERFVAVVHPIKYSGMFNRGNSRRITMCCWAMGSVGCSYFMFTYGLSSRGQCVNHPFKLVYRRLIGVVVFVGFFIGPLGTMLGAHFQMIRTLRRQAKVFKKHPLEKNDGTSTTGKTEEGPWQVEKARKIQRLLFIVFLTYTACWAPNQILFLIYSLGGNVDFSSWYYHWSVVVILANSSINPFIYAVRSRRFRDRFTKEFHRLPCRYWKRNMVQNIAV